LGDVRLELVASELTRPVITDRWSAYSWVDVLRRQLCWAHLPTNNFAERILRQGVICGGKAASEPIVRTGADLLARDHSSAGAIHAAQTLGEAGTPIAFAITGHHAGLANQSDLGERLTATLVRPEHVPDAAGCSPVIPT
jgi:hypothetical protein